MASADLVTMRVGPALVALALSAAPVCAVAGDLPQIQAQGVLRVIVWPGCAPEVFSAGAGPDSGFEREILEGFAALHRVRLGIVTVDNVGARLPALVAGKGDLVGGCFVATDSRRELVNLSAEVFPITHVVVSLKPHRVQSLDQLRRERVGAVGGSAAADQVVAAGVPSAHSETFPSNKELLAALQAKRISALVLSVRVAMLERKRDPSLEFGLFLGDPTSGCFGVRKDQPQLLAALNQYIAQVRRTPTWSRLVVKYFGESALEVLKQSRGTSSAPRP